MAGEKTTNPAFKVPERKEAEVLQIEAIANYDDFCKKLKIDQAISENQKFWLGKFYEGFKTYYYTAAAAAYANVALEEKLDHTISDTEIYTQTKSLVAEKLSILEKQRDELLKTYPQLSNGIKTLYGHAVENFLEIQQDVALCLVGWDPNKAVTILQKAGFTQKEDRTFEKTGGEQSFNAYDILGGLYIGKAEPHWLHFSIEKLPFFALVEMNEGFKKMNDAQKTQFIGNLQKISWASEKGLSTKGSNPWVDTDKVFQSEKGKEAQGWTGKGLVQFLSSTKSINCSGIDPGWGNDSRFLREGAFRYEQVKMGLYLNGIRLRTQENYQDFYQAYNYLVFIPYTVTRFGFNELSKAVSLVTERSKFDEQLDYVEMLYTPIEIAIPLLVAKAGGAVLQYATKPVPIENAPAGALLYRIEADSLEEKAHVFALIKAGIGVLFAEQNVINENLSEDLRATHLIDYDTADRKDSPISRPRKGQKREDIEKEVRRVVGNITLTIAGKASAEVQVPNSLIERYGSDIREYGGIHYVPYGQSEGTLLGEYSSKTVTAYYKIVNGEFKLREPSEARDVRGKAWFLFKQGTEKPLKEYKEGEPLTVTEPGIYFLRAVDSKGKTVILANGQLLESEKLPVEFEKVNYTVTAPKEVTYDLLRTYTLKADVPIETRYSVGGEEISSVFSVVQKSSVTGGKIVPNTFSLKIGGETIRVTKDMIEEKDGTYTITMKRTFGLETRAVKTISLVVEEGKRVVETAEVPVRSTYQQYFLAAKPGGSMTADGSFPVRTEAKIMWNLEGIMERTQKGTTAQTSTLPSKLVFLIDNEVQGEFVRDDISTILKQGGIVTKGGHYEMRAYLGDKLVSQAEMNVSPKEDLGVVILTAQHDPKTNEFTAEFNLKQNGKDLTPEDLKYFKLEKKTERQLPLEKTFDLEKMKLNEKEKTYKFEELTYLPDKNLWRYTMPAAPLPATSMIKINLKLVDKETKVSGKDAKAGDVLGEVKPITVVSPPAPVVTESKIPLISTLNALAVANDYGLTGANATSFANLIQQIRNNVLNPSPQLEANPWQNLNESQLRSLMNSINWSDPAVRGRETGLTDAEVTKLASGSWDSETQNIFFKSKMIARLFERDINYRTKVRITDAQVYLDSLNISVINKTVAEALKSKFVSLEGIAYGYLRCGVELTHTIDGKDYVYQRDRQSLAFGLRGSFNVTGGERDKVFLTAAMTPPEVESASAYIIQARPEYGKAIWDSFADKKFTMASLSQDFINIGLDLATLKPFAFTAYYIPQKGIFSSTGMLAIDLDIAKFPTSILANIFKTEAVTEIVGGNFIARRSETGGVVTWNFDIDGHIDIRTLAGLVGYKLTTSLSEGGKLTHEISYRKEDFQLVTSYRPDDKYVGVVMTFPLETLGNWAVEGWKGISKALTPKEKEEVKE